MRYGYFDDEAREYVIDRVDAPFSMTNYLGTQRMGAVVSHNAGGYCWLDSPQFHRITRFRPNGVPMDFPGHYVYLKDAQTGKTWSVSWQPVGVDLNGAKYSCRHGLSYSTYTCEFEGISARQTLFIPREDGDADPVEIFDVRLRNDSNRPRTIDVTGYVEFSFHNIDIDNQNFQMSLYCAGSFLEDGAASCTTSRTASSSSPLPLSRTPGRAPGTGSSAPIAPRKIPSASKGASPAVTRTAAIRWAR